VIYDVVVPTTGRESLDVLLAALGAADGPLPARVFVVDDRPAAGAALVVRPPAALRGRIRVLRGGGAGPAAARNVGWRAATAPWISFLDDDFAKNVEAVSGKTIVLHCAAGPRSTRALEVLKTKNFPAIYHMNGGYKAWVAAKKPVVAGVGAPK